MKTRAEKSIRNRRRIGDRRAHTYACHVPERRIGDRRGLTKVPVKVPTAEDRKFYLSELRSDECCCGRPKKRGKSFCWRCYRALPGDMQQDLYKSLCDGYGAAYDAAVNYLHQHVL